MHVCACVLCTALAAPLHLQVGFIRVESEAAAGGLVGELHAGSAACPLVSPVTITFFGGRTTALPIGVDPVGSNAGAKGLAVWSRSVLLLHGEGGCCQCACGCCAAAHRNHCGVCVCAGGRKNVLSHSLCDAWI